MISFPFCIREGKAHLRCYKKAGIYTSIWNTCKSKTGWDRNLTDSCSGAGDSNQKLWGKALWDLMPNQEGEYLMRIVGLLAILEEVGYEDSPRLGFLSLLQNEIAFALPGLCGSCRTCFCFFADEHRLHSGKLCLIILTCIAEVGFLWDPSADGVLQGPVCLHIPCLLFTRSWKSTVVLSNEALRQLMFC